MKEGELEPVLAVCNKCGMALRCEGCSSVALKLGAATARIEELTRCLRNMEKERDLAIAHDRQPYPTAAAYEAVCRANEEKDRRLADAWNDAARAINQRAMLVTALKNIIKSKNVAEARKITRDVLDALDVEMKVKD